MVKLLQIPDMCFFVRFVTGIEFREGSLVIGPKNNTPMKKGMVFNVAVGLSDLSNKDSDDPKFSKYSLFIGDTVVVQEVSVRSTTLLPMANILKRKVQTLHTYKRRYAEVFGRV